MPHYNVYWVDDTDPHIDREPADAWPTEVVPNSYNDTLSYTITKNAQFRVNFSGTRIAVYGTYNATNFNDSSPSVYFSLDQVPPALPNVPTSPNVTDPNQPALPRIYDSGVLEDGQHNLTVVSGSSSDGFPVWIDLLEIEATKQEMTFPTGRLAHPPGLSPGVIAGIAVGGLFFVLLAAVGGWYVRRKMGQPRDGKGSRNFDILGPDAENQKKSVIQEVFRYKMRVPTHGRKKGKKQARSEFTQASTQFSTIIYGPGPSTVHSSQRG